MNRNNEKYTVEHIVSRRDWTKKLFSFHTTRHAGFRFTPGQFARLGIVHDEGIIWRAYSMASAPYDKNLEFYSIVVPDGAFTERLALLREGDSILVEKASYGFLTTSRFVLEPGREHSLWLMATGTGLAPFISILHDPEVWREYAHLVLVHSVREPAELAYRDTIAQLVRHPLIGELAKKLIYVPIVTRAQLPGALDKRITTLTANGELEQHVGLILDPEYARVMVCGNPEMVEDTRHIFGERGFTVSRRGKPGQIAFENYW